ncbi:hypothetical protein [Deinococcus psychrotolerans]|nr:hypothetical protein [Deinococcus psychrotolerans]
MSGKKRNLSGEVDKPTEDIPAALLTAAFPEQAVSSGKERLKLV